MASGSAPAVLALLGIGGLAAAWLLRDKSEPVPAAGTEPGAEPETVAPGAPAPNPQR